MPNNAPTVISVRVIRKILVANRGEIAIRVFRACTEMDIATVAIYSHEDRYSLHRYKADQAFQVGIEGAPIRAYLDIEAILDVAEECGADAIHPGYGFLSERADFARACAARGIVFLGPSPAVLEAMGDKVAARAAAAKAGLPIIPGSGNLETVEAAQEFAMSVGYPVILKAAHGGGGRGMRVARDMGELERLFETAQRESQSAFGRGEIFLEKYLERPKHIEVQLLGDLHGNLVHLHERDCSVQRRYQKVVEIAPAVTLGTETRKRLHDDALKLGRAIGYQNAGTVEFLVLPDGSHFFIEVNPRLQVEHTVTEQVTGIDLVKAQIRVAMGKALAEQGIVQARIAPQRFSIQCRVTTEDPADNFNPSFGKLVVYRSATGFGVRLDQASAFAGATISSHYDSLLVKVIASATNFADACATARRALSEFRIRGVKTNIPFLENVLSHPTFVKGECTTSFLAESPELFRFGRRRDRGTRLLRFLAETTVNGSAMIPATHWARKVAYAQPKILQTPRKSCPIEGTRQLLEKLGPDKFASWMGAQKRLLLTDTTFRDAHQSLLATRMRSFDMLRIAPAMAHRGSGLLSLEMWGGATFDAQLRFLRENPWNRLRRLREAIPNIAFQMLLRGSNAVGYTSYPDNLVQEFVREAAREGIDIFRIFDSLNWPEQMQVAIDAVREVGKLAEVTLCYSGDLADPAESKFTRDYYKKLALNLKKRGAHVLAIKDMAGLLRPAAARVLVQLLREETGLPVHLHTHDTAGVQAATYWEAAASGVAAVDCAFGAMSGLTSQPNLESIVAMMANTSRDTGLKLTELNPISDYWETVRRIYAPFESGLLAGSAQVYDHEMPGGQYANLRVQARALGIEDRWPEIKATYAEVNRLFGRIIKVTPSSKVIGDFALYLVSHGIEAKDVLAKGESLSFPQSVIDMLAGKLGQPHGDDGWPPELVRVVLKGKPSDPRRPGSLLPPIDLKKVQDAIPEIPERESTFADALSSALYPKVFEEYLDHRRRYGDVSMIPSPAFFYGLKENEEISVTIEPGKTLLIKLLAVSEPNAEGVRTVFFELNGQPRSVDVLDRATGKAKRENERADPKNPHHIAAPIPGKLVSVRVRVGDRVKKDQPLCTLEAMKMETTILAPSEGTVRELLLTVGASIGSGDLLLVLESGA